MKLLLVEDEQKLGAAIKRGLQQRGYAVDWERTAEDGLAAAKVLEYDLAILDRMLPGGADGLVIARELRASRNQLPILMLTARDAVTDRVTGIQAGADDYLGKPFAFDELLARVAALLRRPRHVVGPEVTLGNVRLDTNQRQVFVRAARLSLSPKEYALLEYLTHRRGAIVSKDTLISHVWDFDADILPNTVEVMIGSLRKKLRRARAAVQIETVRGFGYRLRT